MPLTINIDPNALNSLDIILRNASAHNDGAMTPLMAARLAALWTAAGLPDPVVVNRTQPLLLIPSATTLFGVIIPTATSTTDGVVSSTQAAALDTLWANASLPEPSFRVGVAQFTYSPSLLSQRVVLPIATPASGGLMSATMAAQLAALLVPIPVLSYTDVITADDPYIWWRFNEMSPDATIVDTQGHVNGTENDPAATLYRQPGLITEVGQFSQGAVDAPSSFITTSSFSRPFGPMSLEWWTKPAPMEDDINGILLLGDNGGGTANLLARWVNSDRILNIQIDSVTVVSVTGGYALNTRVYIAVTYDVDGSVVVYKNGVPVGSGSHLTSGINVTNIVWSPIGNFGGVLDEIAFYDKVLTAPQVLAHYNAGIQ